MTETILPPALRRRFVLPGSVLCALLGGALLWSAAAADPGQRPLAPPVANRTQRYEVPYRLTDTQHVLVRAKINGTGPFHFILDTGAPAVFITRNVAQKAGVRPGPDGWAVFERFDLEGGITLAKVKSRVEDLVQLDGMNTLGLAGVELHGVIGYNVLARFRITYDFTATKLPFEYLPDFEPPDPERLRAEGADDLQMMGPFLKMLAALTGLRANFAVVPRGFAGLEVEQRDGQVAVRRVYPGTPAARAGLQPGDVIVSVRTRSIDTPKDLYQALSRAQPGSRHTVTIQRQGQTLELTVELGRGL